MGQATTPARFVAAKAITRCQVGDVLHEIIKRVFFVLQTCEHTETFCTGEAGHQTSAPGELEMFVEQAEPIPEPDERGFGIELKTLGAMRTGEAERCRILLAAHESCATCVGPESAWQGTGNILRGFNPKRNELDREKFFLECRSGFGDGHAVG